MSPEFHSASARKGAINAHAAKTPEERTALARKAARARWDQKKKSKRDISAGVALGGRELSGAA